MKLRVLLPGAALAVSGFLGAPAVHAQDLPDLPGMGQVGQTTGGTSTGTGTGTGALPDLPGSRTAPGATRPAARTSSDAPSRLPATGAAVEGFALLGIALVAGGRALVELSRPGRRA